MIAGTLILSWPGPMDHWKFEGLKVVQSKNYGDAHWCFIKKLAKILR